MASYQWLNARASSNAAALNPIKTELLFLNILSKQVTVEQLQSHWCAAKNILYCEELVEDSQEDNEPSVDERETKWVYAQAQLRPFKDLLLACGSLNYRPPEALTKATSANHRERASSARDRYNKLRRERKLLDAKLIPNDGDAVEVHRVILASISDHLYEMFTNGNFAESLGTQAESRIDISGACLKLIVGKCKHTTVRHTHD
jgi:hypothetical protein